jgi:hypothetical protein
MNPYITIKHTSIYSTQILGILFKIKWVNWLNSAVDIAYILIMFYLFGYPYSLKAVWKICES